MEDKIKFKCGDLTLSGLFNRGDKNSGVVVTHPHPLYGGDMYNSVVETLVQAYSRQGYATLRFNFRGVGQSQGKYDDGRGEQEDVAAALSWLIGQGISSLDLAGYSFGAWVCALGAASFPFVQRLVLISPPVAFVNFDGVVSVPSLSLVVTGSHDEIAPPELVKPLVPTWNSTARFQVIEGADHFFSGFEKELEETLLYD